MNYVPSSQWWYSWVDWDAESIRADLAAIAGLGGDHIRIHCLWPVFQPNPSLVSPTMLNRLRDLHDIADEVGLDVVVTLFNGWLSGFDFRPDWLPASANVFADEPTLVAQELLIQRVGEAVGAHPRFLGIDLSNEPSVIAMNVPNRSTTAQGDAWLKRMFAAVSRATPSRLATVGMDHLPWMTDGTPFTRASVAEFGTVTSVHAWTYFTGALERYGVDGTGTQRITEYLLELARAYSADPQRPVWLQEFGVSGEWMAPDAMERYVTDATEAALGVDGLWGVTWWASHDIDRRLGGFAALEYDLGLLTVDNAVKATGERFRDAALAARALPNPPQKSVALVLADGRTPDLRFADAFFELVDRGISPTIVLESRSVDSVWLAARGITQVLA